MWPCVIGWNRSCYCFQLKIFADSKFKTMGYIWNSLPYDYHREFPQVTDDADLNLVTKAGNL